MGKDQVILDEPANYLHPCWTDLFDSQNAFDSALDRLYEWYDYMSNKIQNLHQKRTETRVRFTGIFEIIFSKNNVFIVALTLRISNTRDNISKLIEQGLEKLDADGKICTELSCICNQQYPKCPQINFIS